MKNSLVRFLKFFIGAPLSLLALFFIGKLIISKGDALLKLHAINPYLLIVAIVCFLGYFFIRALFWQKLLKEKHISFSYKQTAVAWGISEFKRYVPGNIWSFVARHQAYKKLGSEGNTILAGILQESEFIIIACLILSLFSVNFLIFGFISFPLQKFALFFVVLSIFVFSVFFLFHQTILQKISCKRFFPQLPFWSMVKLLSLIFFAFFFFGLGTYFSIASFIYLYPPHILSLAGFFVFSLLIGYVSFITPMGLGVREAVMTVGLSKYSSTTNAAAGAIFSRIIFIFSELLFLIICILWNKTANKTIQKIETYILKHKYAIVLSFFTILYIAYFTLAGFLRYDNFFTGRFDLGNMDQTVWNTIHGRIFQITNPDGIHTVSRLAFHADFMLILLAPFYLIWQDPRMLLLIQTIALGLGAIFVYAIAKNRLKKESLSFAFAVSYLIYPAINYANLYDFHAVTIAVPFFLAAWYFLLKRRFLVASILLLFAGTTKEEVWMITGMMGLFIAFWKKQYGIGIMLAVVSFGLFYYLFWQAIPSIRGTQHFALSYYADFGTTPTSVIQNIPISPIKILTIITGKQQLLYVAQLFAPVFFLPFLFPFVLIFIMPELGIDLISSNAQLHSIYYHYAAILAPFIFIAAIYGLQALFRIRQTMRKYAFFLILLPAIISAYLYGPLPGAISFNHAIFTSQLPYAGLIDDFLASIPKKYSVAATNNIGSHLSHRRRIFTIPVGIHYADIVVFLLNDQFAKPSLLAQKKMAKQLDNNTMYVKLISYKDFVVYKKKNVPTYYKKSNKSLLPLFKGH